ncbi:MAG: hypothetical protein ACREX8_01835, partial [Gammaproteobacteria bacterium]
ATDRRTGAGDPVSASAPAGRLPGRLRGGSVDAFAASLAAGGAVTSQDLPFRSESPGEMARAVGPWEPPKDSRTLSSGPRGGKDCDPTHTE